MTQGLTIPEYQLPKIRPRGAEWNKRALFMPDDAVPFQMFDTSTNVLGFSSRILFQQTRLLNDHNGLRMARIHVSGASQRILVTFQKDFVTHPMLPPFTINDVGQPADLDIFAVYEAGDVFQMLVTNLAGTQTPVDVFLAGWYF